MPNAKNKIKEISSTSDLITFLEDGCKPKNAWMIGTEHEKFAYKKDTLEPIPYDGKESIFKILTNLEKFYNWNPLEENGNLIGLEKDSAKISLEPGGQLELSGAPLKTIHETCTEASIHLKEVKSVADKAGIGFIGLGASPDWMHHQMPLMPKGRYALMSEYMKKVGNLGLQMMYRTCTIQVNLDFSSEADMIKKFRTALALQPIATALFANSPFFEGKFVNHKSWRSRIWRDLDASRTGMLPFVFEKGMGFERYVDYALDVPMYFVYRNGQYINALGQSFRDFLNAKLPALPGERPLISDWEDHLTTLFPEVRLKQFLEMRGADGGAWKRICALPAFWVGLLYDSTALNAAWDVCKNWSTEQREALRVIASEKGLSGSVDSISIRKTALDLLNISHFGLKARREISPDLNYQDESHFLDILFEVVKNNSSPADELISKFKKEWSGDLSIIYQDYSY